MSKDAQVPMESPAKVTLKRRNSRRDMQQLITMVLDSPLGPGNVDVVDGTKPISAYEKANTDVKTRIILQYALDAMHGNIKAADFLFKYGGYEPVHEANVSLDTPTFIEDIPLVSVGSGTTVLNIKEQKKLNEGEDEEETEAEDGAERETEEER